MNGNGMSDPFVEKKKRRKTAKVGTLVLLKQTARERTREPSENQWKGGVFRKSERKRSVRKKKKKNEVKYRRSWWKKCKERIVSLFTARRKEENKEKEGRKRDRRPQDETSLGQVWKMCIFPMLMAQNWLCVNAAAEGLQKRTEMIERWQQEVPVKDSQKEKTGMK